MDLTDEQELDLKCLCSDKLPCEWRTAMHTLHWIVDLKCPVRKIVREKAAKYFAEIANKQYDKEKYDSTNQRHLLRIGGNFQKEKEMMYINVTPLPKEGKYRLNQAVIIEGVHVPAGFKWDGASIPRFLWRVVDSPFQPDLMVPSLVHDYLYEQGDKSGFTREEADKLFHKLLIANGVDEDLAETMYSGVRVGGGSHYG